MKLVVVSNLAHYRDGDRVVAGSRAPVAEIDALAELFDEVVHVAEIASGPPPRSAAAYAASSVRLRLLPQAGAHGLAGRWSGLAAAPRSAVTAWGEMQTADAAYIRCPSRLGFLGAVALAVSPPRVRWVRYTGEWRPAAGDPWPYRIQRLWLRQGLSRAVTAVYGAGDPANEAEWIAEWPNPCLTAAAWREAGLRSASKTLETPLRLLFVGRLDENKNPLRAVSVAAELQSRGWDIRLDLAGDGPLRRATVRHATNLLGSRGQVHGLLDRPALETLYERAHFLLAPSATEGWPKAVTEAMAFGVAPIASPVGAIPQMLRHGRAGRLTVGGDRQWTDAVEQLARRPDEWLRLSTAARRAASSALIESYITRVERLIVSPPFQARPAGASR